MLKVQHVSDEQKYLQNLGRARIALMIRDAQNAENEANQKIAEEEAAARQRAESAQKKAEATVLQKRQPAARASSRRWRRRRKSIENEAAIAAETARASAEQELQRLRAELEKLRLRVRRGAAGRGRAPGGARRGPAATRRRSWRTARPRPRRCGSLAAQWQAAGAGGRDVYLLQQLRSLVEAAVERAWRAPRSASSRSSTAATAQAYAAFVANFPAAVARVMDETARAVGDGRAARSSAREEVTR